jgi:hypothetical protein
MNCRKIYEKYVTSRVTNLESLTYHISDSEQKISLFERHSFFRNKRSVYVHRLCDYCIKMMTIDQKHKRL